VVAVIDRRMLSNLFINWKDLRSGKHLLDDVKILEEFFNLVVNKGREVGCQSRVGNVWMSCDSKA
jgi:hypothetical protein